MKNKTAFKVSLAFLCLSIFSCTINTPKADTQTNRERKETDGYSTTSETGSASSVDNDDENMPLDMYLNRISGVNVSGSGSNAVVTIRGISSFSASNEPLFMLDGQQMGSFSSVYTQLRPQDIGRVTVLKDAADTSIYGTRGSNGVILIYRKKVKK